MLFLLRKIRRKLISKNNKLLTYLLYAVGEILLVVVGILIAVQIESHYSALKERREELVLLAEMKNNLNQDLNDIDNNIEGIIRIINDRNQLVVHLEKHTPVTDSIALAYFRLYAAVFFANNTSAYKTLSSTGLKSISNDSLRQDVTTLYDLHYPSLQIIENNMMPLYLRIMDYRADHILTDLKTKRGVPNNLELIYGDNKFKEHLKSHIMMLTAQLNTYHYIREAVFDLIVNIDREIKRQ